MIWFWSTPKPHPSMVKDTKHKMLVYSHLYIIDGVCAVLSQNFEYRKDLCGARRALVPAEDWHPSMCQP